uniref:Uncharacterized protein n=1 Tax=Chromera velia CCMP2878 TaxID=1169474 RepID=A0A0G4GDQ0_9ALVE|eukprot:Cvel_21422.t1-p1 / transcript=Cvel_21422.t1 / gene=Cvel_21422 / organism=Chromera_velia_CCMP2878 / gene_product=hypothetical protein / transcript_product=hypothetical protein / location=Cvel_scaffold2008:1142-1453(+) / protein_length=104 / sequence_SO=supercontig / SO=protein_coding / is_pseudo=false
MVLPNHPVRKEKCGVYLAKMNDDYNRSLTYEVQLVNGDAKVRSTRDFSRSEYEGGCGVPEFCSSEQLLSAARETEKGALEVCVRLSAPKPKKTTEKLFVNGYDE